MVLAYSAQFLTICAFRIDTITQPYRQMDERTERQMGTNPISVSHVSMLTRDKKSATRITQRPQTSAKAVHNCLSIVVIIYGGTPNSYNCPVILSLSGKISFKIPGSGSAQQSNVFLWYVSPLKNFIRIRRQLFELSAKFVKKNC